jgi:hypothetical protein
VISKRRPPAAWRCRTNALSGLTQSRCYADVSVYEASLEPALDGHRNIHTQSLFASSGLRAEDAMMSYGRRMQ